MRAPASAPVRAPAPAARTPAEPAARPLRVLLVEAAEDGTVGGSHRALVDLVANLDRARFTPVVLFYEDNPFASRLAGEEVHVWSGVRARERSFHGPVGLLRQVRGAVTAIPRRMAFLRRERIDLVHLNNSPALGYEDWLPAAHLLRLPCIAHARGEFWLTRRAIGRTLMRRFEAVLPVSHVMADFARAAGIAEERIRTVHDGIDRDAFLARVHRTREAVRQELGLGAQDFVVSLVAHLRRWKGHELALHAVRRLPEPLRRQLRLLFIGAAPAGEAAYERELRAEVARFGLSDCVLFLGGRDDVPELMAAADVVLHASTEAEPFGLVILEAMVLSRAVLASRLGGPVEIVTPGSGLTFDPRSPEELAEQLARLAADPDLRRRLGEGGRERAEHFRIEHTVAKIESVYDEFGRSARVRRAPR
ncbi:MAG TPA: glycosyltransferase family 4 protein [Myxococcota bacterium]|jgi:glycosyltransferase involved in cell wall biosynthesis|nr:glycosyltransferase family 4 protein [Myxococcota bacterium]